MCLRLQKSWFSALNCPFFLSRPFAPLSHCLWSKATTNTKHHQSSSPSWLIYIFFFLPWPCKLHTCEDHSGSVSLSVNLQPWENSVCRAWELSWRMMMRIETVRKWREIWEDWDNWSKPWLLFPQRHISSSPSSTAQTRPPPPLLVLASPRFSSPSLALLCFTFTYALEAYKDDNKLTCLVPTV